MLLNQAYDMCKPSDNQFLLFSSVKIEIFQNL